MIYQLAADGYNIDINSAFSTNPDGSCTTKNYPATWDHWYSSTKTSRQQARCQLFAALCSSCCNAGLGSWYAVLPDWGGDDLAFDITATAPIFKDGNSSDELIGGLHYMLQRCTDWSGAQYLEPRLVWTNFQDSSRQLKWATTVSLQNTFQQNNCRLHGMKIQTSWMSNTLLGVSKSNFHP
jgi:hypothetical protein